MFRLTVDGIFPSVFVHCRCHSVTGAIQAAVFGWLPVLLWILIGGVFFGAVTDFGALYASVKNQGKSMGMLIEKYIGVWQKTIPAFLLAFLTFDYRSICRYGFGHIHFI